MTETLMAERRSRGMLDLLPEEMERLRTAETAFASVCRAWGYREIRTPVIEPLHLFTSAGTLSPQTLDRVYSFFDWDGWSGERVVLRPDSTIPAARLYAEQLDGGRVAKLFYIQNVFRFTDDGSSREEPQCGVELIGANAAAGDVEIVLLALDALEHLGLTGWTLRLSHAGLARSVLAAAAMTDDEQSVAYDRLLDGDLTVVGEIEARVPQLNAPLRMLFEIEGSGAEYIANVRGALAAAIPSIIPALDELSAVVAALKARGAEARIQAVLARNFEYYSGLVMRIESGAGRLIAGGRYDHLIGVIGGRDVPASGFALYLAPVLESITARNPAGERSVLLEAESGTPSATMYDAADRLRAAGITTETIEGMHSSPTHRLRCTGRSFTLRSGGASIALASIDDVVAAIAGSGS